MKKLNFPMNEEEFREAIRDITNEAIRNIDKAFEETPFQLVFIDDNGKEHNV